MTPDVQKEEGSGLLKAISTNTELVVTTTPQQHNTKGQTMTNTNTTTKETTMETLNITNYGTWEYTNEDSLTTIENLKQAHNQYDAFQNSCQEGIVHAAIKLGGIYADAKVEMGTDKKLATNQAVANYFAKTEATIRNYIKIAENRELIFETPVSQTLSVRNMLKIINGTATQNSDGSVTKDDKAKKPTAYDVKRYQAKITKLADENKDLKDEVINLKKALKEYDKKQARAAALLGEG